MFVAAKSSPVIPLDTTQSLIHERAQPGPCSPFVLGVNAALLPVIPYAIVTGLHDTNLTLALIIGAAVTGGILIFGLLCRILGGYRTWPYTLELAMLVVNVVLLGMAYLEEYDIKRYLPIIANSVYAAFGLLSLIVSWPFAIQYVREFVPEPASDHDKVWRAAMWCTCAWTAAFTTNTLLFLAPLCEGREMQHTNVLNLLFRIIVPIFLVLFAALFTRVWPIRILRHLIISIGFDGTADLRKIAVNPLALTAGSPAFFMPHHPHAGTATGTASTMLLATPATAPMPYQQQYQQQQQHGLYQPPHAQEPWLQQAEQQQPWMLQPATQPVLQEPMLLQPVMQQQQQQPYQPMLQPPQQFPMQEQQQHQHQQLALQPAQQGPGLLQPQQQSLALASAQQQPQQPAPA